MGWNLNRNKHLDHAYVMISHSSGGAIIGHVIVHIDTSDTKSRALINETLGYVALSRPRHDAQIFTDDDRQLVKALSRTNENATALAPERTKAYASADYALGIWSC